MAGEHSTFTNWGRFSNYVTSDQRNSGRIVETVTVEEAPPSFVQFELETYFIPDTAGVLTLASSVDFNTLLNDTPTFIMVDLTPVSGFSGLDGVSMAQINLDGVMVTPLMKFGDDINAPGTQYSANVIAWGGRLSAGVHTAQVWLAKNDPSNFVIDDGPWWIFQ